MLTAVDAIDAARVFARQLLSRAHFGRRRCSGTSPGREREPSSLPFLVNGAFAEQLSHGGSAVGRQDFVDEPRCIAGVDRADGLFDTDEAPWNYMMAISIVYSLPPIAIR